MLVVRVPENLVRCCKIAKYKCVHFQARYMDALLLASFRDQPCIYGCFRVLCASLPDPRTILRDAEEGPPELVGARRKQMVYSEEVERA